VVNSIRSLLHEVFDYAGLFPPAALPMDQATDVYARHISGSDRWITHNFVCPVAWLSDLGSHLSKLPHQTWSVTVLGTSLEGFRQDLNHIDRFKAEAGERAEVVGYEVKGKLSEMQSSFLMPLVQSDFEEIFVELPFSEDGLDALPTLAEFDVIGVKGRSGGLEANAFPSPSLLAPWIRQAIDLDLAMKLTAGLHHPFRVYHDSVQTEMHGFLNVLCAGTLAESDDLSSAEIEDILRIEDPRLFEFSDEGFSVSGHTASLDDIEAFRSLFHSIGSCSITEPMDDLTRLGLLALEARP